MEIYDLCRRCAIEALEKIKPSSYACARLEKKPWLWHGMVDDLAQNIYQLRLSCIARGELEDDKALLVQQARIENR